MGKIIAVVNQKGGVGKTTTAVNLTAALHDLGLRTLLCDFDPQANATSGLGVDKRKIKYSVYDVVINDVPASQAVVQTKFGDVLPSHPDLAGAGVELLSMANPNHRLGQALKEIRESYDVIFIDCPPSLELLTLNGLSAADSILVPVQCEYYALEGLSDLMATLRMVKKRMNPKQKRSRDVAFYLLLMVILLCGVYMLTMPNETAEKLGYLSPQNFNRAFVRYWQCSPNAYRKSVQKPK